MAAMYADIKGSPQLFLAGVLRFFLAK